MRLRSNLQKSKNISDLYNEVAESCGVSVELVKEIEKHNFRYVYHKIRKQEGVEIMFHNFGTFYTSLKFINNRIQVLLRMYRNGKISRKEAVDEISVLWKERQKFIK